MEKNRKINKRGAFIWHLRVPNRKVQSIMTINCLYDIILSQDLPNIGSFKAGRTENCAGSRIKCKEIYHKTDFRKYIILNYYNTSLLRLKKKLNEFGRSNRLKSIWNCESLSLYSQKAKQRNMNGKCQYYISVSSDKAYPYNRKLICHIPRVENDLAYSSGRK